MRGERGRAEAGAPHAFAYSGLSFYLSIRATIRKDRPEPRPTRPRFRSLDNTNAGEPYSTSEETFMQRIPSRLRRSSLLLAAAALAAWGLGAAVVPAAHAQAQGQADMPHGRLINVKVHGRALEGNLEGESPDRVVSIYLPPSYETDTAKRYPVVYLLHGYHLTNEYWTGRAGQPPASIDVPAMMDRDIASGKGREMILVMPNANSKYDGSMYSTSVTIGDWESFIADDLVGYVDSHFRTLANRDSRGLAGHSMGGYGTIRIGMKRPDVFGSLYIMSACCLMNNPAAFANRNRNGNGNGQNEARPGPSGSQGQNQADGQNRNPGGIFANVIKAEAAAWSPDPRNPPTYFDLPGDKGGLGAPVATKWIANSPLAMIDQYIPNLKEYSAIGMDVGKDDTLKGSNEELSNILGAYGIGHQFEIYDGNHFNHIDRRVENVVIPFFSQHLDFGPDLQGRRRR